ncbi:hypothetical protein F5I97DRAFT_1810965 [Phlebopus sp. FC_14]|nr:hypothetical protein F5I97DRAFT_1810965 [Phlebopus sp. FC_14]
MSDGTPATTALALPIDILIIIMEHLDLKDLVNLSYTCKLMNVIVRDFGWSVFLRRHQRQSFTLHSARTSWSSLAQVRYNALSDRSWSRAKFMARPLSRPWAGKLQPALAVSTSGLLVAAGKNIYSYVFQDPSVEGCGTKLVYEGSYTLILGRGLPERDITSICFLKDTGEDRIVTLGFEDGIVEQVYLPPRNGRVLHRRPNTALHHHGGEVVESICRSRNYLLSLSSWGSVSLSNASFLATSPAQIHLRTRSWTSYLCMSSSTPFAAFGMTSKKPLTLHYITESAFMPTPSVVLDSPKSLPSAVYGITSVPPASPMGASDQIVVSGWYDGAVRVHDLRVSERVRGSTETSTHLRPVLTLQDPWSLEPVYCVSCGGGSASFVAAGTARHSVVAFWDVRQPTRGWSVHAPGNDASPVYSVILESSRLFGATQSRSFVYDFGPGVTRDTYPSVARSDDPLKLMKNGIGYQVYQYYHSRGGLPV